jgi:hypothetical protein
VSERERLSDYLLTFGPDHGQRVLVDLRDEFVDVARFRRGKTRGLDLAFQEGQRFTVVRILADVEKARRVSTGIEEPDEDDEDEEIDIGGYL